MSVFCLWQSLVGDCSVFAPAWGFFLSSFSHSFPCAMGSQSTEQELGGGLASPAQPLSSVLNWEWQCGTLEGPCPALGSSGAPTYRHGMCAPYPPPGIISRPKGSWWCTRTGQCSFRLSECAGWMVSHLNCWYDYYIYIVLLHSWRDIQTWLHKNDPNQYLKNCFKLSCPSSGGVCPLEFSYSVLEN